MVGCFGHGLNVIKPGRKTTMSCCYFSCYCIPFLLSQNVIKQSGYNVKTIKHHQLAYAVNMKALQCSHMPKSLYPLLTKPMFKFHAKINVTLCFSFGASMFRSACASAQSDQSIRSPYGKIM